MNEALRVDVSDRVTVRGDSSSGGTLHTGTGINEDFFVEKVKGQSKQGIITMTLQTSPARVSGNFLILDSATLGKLDTGILGR